MEVAGVVASIISAFGSGRALFQRMAGKKRTGRGREATLSEEEAWLRESLHNRPLEIERSYQQHVQRHGYRYEIGDSIAHSSLAHTLLTLNSGLIKVINRFLAKESMADIESRRTLLSLSEVAAADTLNALSQLSLRLNSQTIPPALKGPARPSKERADDEGSEELRPRTGSSGKLVSKQQKSRSSPPLIRGAWVRPKASNGALTSKKSSGKIKTESTLLKAGGKKGARAKPKQRDESPEVRAKPASSIEYHTQSSETHWGGQSPSSSMLVMPSEVTPRSHAHSYHTARPWSSSTTYTASTRIGEIPHSRSSRGFELQSIPESSCDPRLVEYLMSLPDPTEPDEPKKISRGKRFWRKDNRRAVEAV
ncbi:hypothetical protein DV738_g177, partial [Chaetothyriales sp. CBS 135597]